MPFVTAQDLLEASKQGRYYSYDFKLNTLADAEAILKNTLDKALANNQPNKHDRPWSIVQFDKMLDKDQPWIGFEFETGFDDVKEYRQFINFLWGLNYVAIDREGTGKYPVEVAYPPQTLQDITDNGSLLLKSLEFVNDNGLTPALNPTTFTRRDVGIHAGISTPNIRKNNGVRRIAGILDGILCSLNDKQKKELYGRTALHWGGAQGRDGYIEVKVFRAIPTVEHVATVTKVTQQIVKLVLWLEQNPDVKEISNAYDVLSGKTDTPKAA